MTDEKPDNEMLSDETLDAVSGGGGDNKVIVTCTQCRKGRVAVPASGTWAETCPCCGATMICYNGRLQFCLPAQQRTPADVDTDDGWLS